MKNMKVILIIGLFILASFLPIIKADVQTPLSMNNNTSAEYTYLSDTELLITYQLTDLNQQQITTKDGEFTMLEIPNSGFIGDIGSPQLPAVTQTYAVPTPDLSFQILGFHILETRHINRLYPVQYPQSDSDASKESDIAYDEAAYQKNSNSPAQIAEIVSSGNIRDIPFIKIRFSPVQYNPKQQTAIIYDIIRVKLTFPIGERVSIESNYIQKPFYNLYQSVFSNWQGFIDHTAFQQQVGLKSSGCEYLIITHQNYYTQAKELADWKHSTGLMAKVVNTSEIGTTSTLIRQYIKNAYDSWDPRPSYVLLMGDAETLPTNNDGGVYTDLLYALVSGSDYYPDIFIGRIPADNVNQAEVMIQKTLTYEQTPPTLPSFYQNFVVAAYFQDDDNNHYEDRRFVLTSEEVRDYLMSLDYNGQRIYVTDTSVNPTHYNNGYYANGEPLPPELLKPTFPWNGDAADICTALNQGIFILNHRDHGMESGWGDPYFTTADFSSFSNGELLPVVFSINCLTGAFATTECFCEEFLRKADGGAVAVFGASEISYSGYNDWLCRGFYDGMWPAFDTEIGDNVSLYTLGEILNYGKAYMADTWGDPWGYEEYTFELFHVFGDPALDMYTALPGPLEVTSALVSDMVQVTVKSAGIPVAGARVCIRQESGFYKTGITDANGVIQLDKTGAESSEEVVLVVTAHNYLYHTEGFMLNQKPEKPNPPTGTIKGKPNTEYIFKASTTDADGDRIYYNFSWGDGTYSDWVGPFDSGVQATTKHSWAEKGTFNITVKAKDTKGDESVWSEPLIVSMPTSFDPSHPILQWLYNIIMNRFPLLENLLQMMVQ